MKVLMVNKYFFENGGAEKSLFQTAGLLSERGNEVSFFSMRHPRNLASPDSAYFVSNVDYGRPGLKNRIDASLKLLYSLEAKRMIGRMMEEKRPDIVHLNNIYHQISPSIIHAIKGRGVPVVMTLRDYKMVCASYAMLSGGSVCERCKGGSYYHCLTEKCVKGSLAASLLNTLEMYLHHNVFKLYDMVDAFISPSIFLKEKTEKMGFNGKVFYLPNFVDGSAFAYRRSPRAGRAAYLGRLSREKGVATLLDAVKGIGVALDIIGEGPLRGELEEKARRGHMDNVEFHGYMDGERLKDKVAGADFLIVPSEWYENNPRSVIEAFAIGRPVIGSRMGGIPELVKDGRTGLTFEAGDPEDLRAKILELAGCPERTALMGVNARHFVEERLNPDIHYRGLMDIYTEALKR